MLNTHDLESRWLRYKIKSYIPYIILFISLAILFVTFYYVFNSSKNNLENTTNDLKVSPVQTQNSVIKQSKQSRDDSIEQIENKDRQTTQTQTHNKEEHLQKAIQNTSTMTAPPVTAQQNTRTLTPSLDFMKQMQNSMSPYYEMQDSEPKMQSESHFYSTQTRELEQQAPTVRHIEEVTLDNGANTIEEPEAQAEESVTHKINITRQNTQDDIANVLKRFKKNNNPALSLFVAKKYYELGDYENSYNYALITNQINRDIDASWILFTKSLVKLGKKDMAIKTLNEYISQSHSNTAQILLDEIASGKFK